MIFRECSADYNIKLLRAPYGVAELGKLKPKGRFCVVVDGAMVYDGDKFPIAEKRMVSACKKKHKAVEKQHGRMLIGKHQIVNHRLVG